MGDVRSLELIFSEPTTVENTTMNTEQTSPFDETIERRNTGSLKWDKYTGRDVLPLWVADMDFRSPQPIIDAAKERVSHGIFGYGKTRESLTGEILRYLKESHGAVVEESWLVWLPGCVPALNMACRACGKPGSSVMTCSPVYPPFLSAPENAGKKLIDVPLKEPGGADGRWTFDFPAMEAAVRPDTSLFMLCNPHNPTGRVYDRGELDALGQFCEKHDLVLCSDEIHCDLILDPGIKHISAAAFDSPLRDRTITLLAPSKTYNIAGLAFSYAIIPDTALRTRFRRAGQGFLSEINVVAQDAAEAAYRDCATWREELVAYLRENRDILYEFVHREMPQIKLAPMESTYLAWLDVRPLGLKDPVGFFEEAGVGLSDGNFFGLPGFVRFNFGCPRSTMMEGLFRMRNAFGNL